MAQLAIAIPTIPGGGDALRRLAEECSGPRKDEFQDFHERVGLEREAWYLQQTPQGELFILVLEGDPLGALGTLAASDHEFDQWFLDRAKEVHGMDLRQPLPGPPPEQVFEG